MQDEDLVLLSDKLEAIYQIMGAKGKIRQKRSRPVRAHLSVRCPKLSVQLEIGSDAHATCFEVATQALNMELLAGGQQHEQLQSGAGPLSIEVLIHPTEKGKKEFPRPGIEPGSRE